MNILIDTPILLWWLSDTNKLSSSTINIIENPKNIIYVSVACLWEINIKKSIGKLKSPDNIIEILNAERFTTLPINSKHVMALNELPNIHQDPFDRIQIAQAITENLSFVTRDKHILKYKLKTIKG